MTKMHDNITKGSAASKKRMLAEQEVEGWGPKQMSCVLEALKVKPRELAKSSQ